MSWLSKRKNVDLDAVVQHYRRLESDLTRDYAKGLKTLKEVEALASLAAQAARAKAQALTVAASSLSRKFDEPFEDVIPYREGGMNTSWQDGKYHPVEYQTNEEHPNA